MALSNTFEFAGLTVTNGYLRVNEISGSKNQIAFTLAYQSASGEDALKHEAFTFTPDLDGDNFIAQAYAYLKSLPDFSDATDV